ncbi:MAG: hypothetical protein OHK0012_00360 [Synechococcales cyanobacterium]
MELEDLRPLLQGSLWADAPLAAVGIPDSEETALAMAVPSEQAEAAWRWWRDRLPVTQRYPLITVSWMGQAPLGDWIASVLDPFYFQEEYGADTSPARRLAEAETYGAEAEAAFLAERAQFETYDRVRQLTAAVLDCQSRYGRSPTMPPLATIIDLERFLLEWEEEQGFQPDVSLDYLSWFDPGDQPTAVVLLPTSQGWQTLAYLSRWGGSRHAMPLLRKWQEHYGLELVSHYGTMLQGLVARRPLTVAAAFAVATEHFAIAPCTLQLPGVTVRDHARALLHLDRWFLHERP